MRNYLPFLIVCKICLVLLTGCAHLKGRIETKLIKLAENAVESTYCQAYTPAQAREDTKRLATKSAITQTSEFFGTKVYFRWEDMSEAVTTAKGQYYTENVKLITRQEGEKRELRITRLEYPQDDQERVCARMTVQKVSDSPPDLSLRIHGSNTIGSELAPELAKAFLAYKGFQGIEDITNATLERVIKGGTPDSGRTAAVEIKAHGSATAFASTAANRNVGLENNHCDIGMSSRRVESGEGVGNMRSWAQEHVIALDGIAIITHPSNPLKELSISTLKKIFSGKINSWEAVTSHVGPIRRYSRDRQSGTYEVFNQLVLKGAKLNQNLIEKFYEDSYALAAQVAADPNAIGFIGLPYIGNAKALAIRVSDQGGMTIIPSQFSIRTEDYPLTRRLYFYLPPNPTPLAVEFVNFSLRDEPQNIVNKIGFVGLGNKVLPSPLKTVQSNPAVPPKYRQLTQNANRSNTPFSFRFQTNSFELDSLGHQDLKRLLSRLYAVPDIQQRRLILIGFSDPRGTQDYNLKLSVQRAKAVKQELQHYGVHLPITTAGFGEEPSLLIDPREYLQNGQLNLDGLQKNRRVEVWLTQ